MAAEEFPLFPRLPPELRHEIWRAALTQPWSITSFKRAGWRRGGARGSCSWAGSASSAHLFVVRDVEHDLGPAAGARARHLVVNAACSARRSSALRSVVVVAVAPPRRLPALRRLGPALPQAGEPANIYRQAWDQHRIDRLLRESPDGSPLPRFYMRTRDDIRGLKIVKSQTDRQTGHFFGVYLPLATTPNLPDGMGVPNLKKWVIGYKGTK
ncbi:hypothetical protein F4775DRAFT_594079 [Biscogniauxia sp. FL1348]|nr:hypothetical protein F4775DRAFT_594079 [Biscogniauxia sp. FL1348]